MSISELSKNDWIMPFLGFYRSVSVKLQMSVANDPPVPSWIWRLKDPFSSSFPILMKTLSWYNKNMKLWEPISGQYYDSRNQWRGWLTLIHFKIFIALIFHFFFGIWRASRDIGKCSRITLSFLLLGSSASADTSVFTSADMTTDKEKWYNWLFLFLFLQRWIILVFIFLIPSTMITI